MVLASIRTKWTRFEDLEHVGAAQSKQSDTSISVMLGGMTSRTAGWITLRAHVKL